jgi:Yip1-like protein
VLESVVRQALWPRLAPNIYMANTTVPTGAIPAPKNLLARFVGVITEPRATFESVVAHPKWLGMLVVTTLLVTVCSTLPMTTEAGREALLETQVRQMESFGMQVNDEMYQQMRSRIGIAPYTTAAGVVIMSPLVTAVLAGILFAIFNVALGGSATFKQVYSVVVHAGVISTLGQMFTGPLNYFRGSMASATNLSVLLPMLPDGSFVGRLAGMIDLFIIWWVFILAVGLAVLYRRRTQPIALSLFGAYAVIALIAATVMSRLGGAR